MDPRSRVGLRSYADSADPMARSMSLLSVYGMTSLANGGCMCIARRLDGVDGGYEVRAGNGE